MAVAVAGLAWLPSSAQAQEKGGETMMRLAKPIETMADAQAVQPGDTIVMSCPKCKSTWVTIATAPAKTGSPGESKSVERHACPGCESKMVVQGTGKTATAVLQHVCKKCGSTDALCCVVKKGDMPMAK
jgi:Zn finger protein HypA/HybF involved in hydrogenase expression